MLGSKKSYECKFETADGRGPEPYSATVSRLGLDLGVTGKTVMVWTVLAATSDTGECPQVLTECKRGDVKSTTNKDVSQASR